MILLQFREEIGQDLSGYHLARWFGGGEREGGRGFTVEDVPVRVCEERERERGRRGEREGERDREQEREPIPLFLLLPSLPLSLSPTRSLSPSLHDCSSFLMEILFFLAANIS